jgi:glutaredoxin
MAVPRIRVYSRSWCEDSQAAKEFLTERGLHFEDIDIETVPEASEFVKRANHGKEITPTFEVDGRTFSSSPFNQQRVEDELHHRR